MFKKRLCIFTLMLSVILIALTACNSQNDYTPIIPTAFESEFSANISGFKIEGHISKPDIGMCTVSLTYPETLSGLEIKCVGETVTSTVYDTSFTESLSSFPTNNFIKSITNALDALSKPDTLTVTSLQDCYKISSSSQFGSFYILQSKEEPSLKSLTIEKTEIWLDFSNFKITE